MADMTPTETFERYVWAGMTRNADAQAEMRDYFAG
jgi:hypothetical protein